MRTLRQPIFQLLMALLITSSGMIMQARAQTPPNAPTSVTATGGVNSAHISFTVPSSNGGAAITNYEYSTNNGSSWTALEPARTDRTFTITGLTSCTAYDVKVRAVNSAGSGTASSAVSVTPRIGQSGINLTSRAAAGTNSWRSVTYGNGLFVATPWSGQGSKVMTSSDGLSWTSRNSTGDNTWTSVTYGNGLFVAVANNGSVMTSPDGTTWTSRSGVGSNNWGGVTYGNGVFVAVAGNGSVMTSPDGTTWTSRTAARAYDWSSVTYGNGLFVAVAWNGSAAGNRVMTSPDGTTWTSRTSAADNNWESVTYGNGLFVAVSSSGTNRVMTSPDGTTWTSRSAAENNGWKSVTYGNGLFVAVSTDGTNKVMTSPDGITWTAKAAAVTSNWYGVAYGNGLFVAVSSDGTGHRAMSSTEVMTPGIPTINSITALSTTQLQVAFTAPSSTGSTAISNYEYSLNNGSTWVTPSPAVTASPMTISGLTQGTTYNVQLRARNTTGTGLGCGTATVNATTLDIPNAPTSVTATGGVNSAHISFTVPSSNGGAAITNYEYSTNNGSSWTALEPARNDRTFTITGLTNCTAYDVKVRAVNSVGSGSASAAVSVTPQNGQQAGITWTSRTAANSSTWYSVTYGNGLFVAVAFGGTGNLVMTSPDGITWTSRTAALNNSWSSVTYGNGLFVAVAAFGGTGNRVMTSPDGTTWTSSTASQSNQDGNNWQSVCYGNGLFVAVANGGSYGANYVMTSPDGITWTSRVHAVANLWRSVTYGNGLFVAVANSGTGNRVMTSPDGITWTSRSSAADNEWYSVTYGNGLFVAVASSGTNNRVMTSPDGINWTSRTSAANNGWNSVTYGNGLFVALSIDGINRMMTSPDGITWTSRSSAENNNWHGVTYGAGLFVAVSGNGTNRVMSSSDVLTPGIPTINSITPRATQMIMSFTAPSSTGSSAISNYEYSLNNGSTWVTPSHAVTSSPFTINGLTQGTTYNVLLRAVNSAGSGCGSAATNATTVIPTVPNAPTAVSASAGVTAAYISFTAPSNDGGVAITNYEYSTNNGSSWTALSPASTSTPLYITGLTNCTAYDVQVRAVNSAGTGTASSAVSVTPQNGQPAGVRWTSRSSAADNVWVSVTYGNGLFVAVAQNGTNQVMTSPDGITWTSRTAAASNQWRSVTYGNGVFVAVSNTGTNNRVMTSSDGITWTSRTNPTNNEWQSVTYGNGLFVAVSSTGTNNRVMTSPDGITWTTGASAVDNGWYAVTYGNGLFVATANSGTNNRVMTSPDGISWTSRTSAADHNWYGLTYGNGLFVAVAGSNTENNLVMTSPDGINWTSRTSAASNVWYGVTYGSGLFVAVSASGTGNRVMTSPNGITWTSRVSAANNNWGAVTHGNGLFVAVGYSGTNNRVMTSSDLFAPGIPTISSITPSTSTMSIAFAAPASVGSSAISNYEYSVDNGSTWVTPSPAVTTSPFTITGLSQGITYNVRLRAVNSEGSGCGSATENVTTLASVANAPTAVSASAGVTAAYISFTAPSNNGGAAITNYEYSTNNGSSWTALSPASTSTPLYITGLTNCTAYDLQVRAVNSAGSGTASAAVSVTPQNGQPVGVTWTSRTEASNNEWVSVTYGNGLFVAVSYSGTGSVVMTSPDGITWTSRTSALENWRSVTYGNGLFVAVASSGTGNRVMTSPDGITWTSRNSAADLYWTSVTYGNGLFVAVGNTGTGNRVMTSPDGITWTSRNSAANIAWRSVTYGNGLFVAVAQTGTGNRVMTSPDGITWTSRTSAADNWWMAVTFGNGLFVAVAATGTNRVMTSPDGINWTSRTAAAANDWRSLTYGNGLFVAMSITGTDNRVMTSPDGITWTSRTGGGSNNWGGVTYGNGSFVAVSENGTNRVMTSFDLFAPGIPTISSITPSASTMSIAFAAPASVGTSAISNYEYSVDNGSTWVTPSPAVTTSPFTITGLSQGITYNVRLRAVNSAGSGCGSATENVTTVSSVAAEPTAQPTALYFTTTGSNPYNFEGKFTASASATGYLVVRNTGSAPTFTPADGTAYTAGSQTGGTVVYSGSATGFTESGVTLDLAYHYAVYAFNGSGSNTNYLTTSPLAGIGLAKGSSASGSSVGGSGTLASSSTATTLGFPAAGATVNFPAGTTGTTLNVTKNNSAPSSNIQVSSSIRGMKPVYYSITSTATTPGGYTLILDFSGLGSLSPTQWNSYKVTKRANASSPWVDVTTLGATIVNRMTDGVWGKFTITGLSSFSEFGLGEAYDGVVVSNLDQTIASTFTVTTGDYAGQAFTTDGIRYQLSKVKVSVNAGAANLRAQLYGSTSGGNVNTASTPTNFGSPTLVSGKVYEFTPLSTMKLEPNTQYWLVLYSASGNVEIDYTASLTESGPASFPADLSASSNDIGVSYTLLDADPALFSIEATEVSRTWTGTSSTVWTASGNWTPSETPGNGEIMTIPNVSNDPVLDQSVSPANLLIESGAVVTLGDKNITVTQGLSQDGTISGTTGKLIMAGTAAQGLVGTGTIRHLEINNAAGVVISAGSYMQSITGKLTPTAGTLTTNGNLTLRSSATGTARVGAGSASGGYISGEVITQRYLSKLTGTGRNGRAWRLVTIPVTGTGTLRDVFMAGQSGTDLTVAGNRSAQPNDLGTVVIGHNQPDAATATGAGYDWIGTANQVSSLRYYQQNATSGSFASSQVPTLTTTYTAANQGYMLFARGDRQQTYNGTGNSSATVLQATGALKQGTIDVTIPALASAGFVLVGNPYMAVLDLEQVILDNAGVIDNTVYVWDANIDGNAFKQGGYRAVTRTGASNWTASGAGTNPQYIESGSAFFVKPSSSGGTLSIKESHKVDGTPGIAPHATMTDGPSRLFINLEVADTANRRLVDGAVAFFDTNYKDGLGDAVDITPMTNLTAGSITLRQSGARLSMEGRPWPADSAARTIPVDMRNLGDDAYVIRILPTNMNKEGFTAWLKDRHLNKETALQTEDETLYPFRRTGDLGIDSSRFEIVYRLSKPANAGTLTPDDAAGEIAPRLYPNPAKSADVKLSLGSLPPGRYEVQVLDMSGRLVLTKSVEHKIIGGAHNILGKEKLASGLYTLILMDQNKQPKETLRLVVE